MGRVTEGWYAPAFPQHPFGLMLQLLDSLLGGARFLAEMGEGRGHLVVEAVATYQHVPLGLGQALYASRKIACARRQEAPVRSIRVRPSRRDTAGTLAVVR